MESNFFFDFCQFLTKTGFKLKGTVSENISSICFISNSKFILELMIEISSNRIKTFLTSSILSVQLDSFSLNGKFLFCQFNVRYYSNVLIQSFMVDSTNRRLDLNSGLALGTKIHIFLQRVSVKALRSLPNLFALQG